MNKILLLALISALIFVTAEGGRKVQTSKSRPTDPAGNPITKQSSNPSKNPRPTNAAGNSITKQKSNPSQRPRPTNGTGNPGTTRGPKPTRGQ